jgi:hypothetical protein
MHTRRELHFRSWCMVLEFRYAMQERMWVKKTWSHIKLFQGLQHPTMNSAYRYDCYRKIPLQELINNFNHACIRYLMYLFICRNFSCVNKSLSSLKFLSYSSLAKKKLPKSAKFLINFLDLNARLKKSLSNLPNRKKNSLLSGTKEMPKHPETMIVVCVPACGLWINHQIALDLEGKSSYLNSYTSIYLPSECVSVFVSSWDKVERIMRD